jgi:hypothetical protein
MADLNTATLYVLKNEDETLLDHQPFYCGFHSGAIASRASLAPLHS